MTEHYDFRGGGKRGALDPLPPGKTRITIRIDDDILDWFRDQAMLLVVADYQTTINAVLREHMMRQREPLELTLRRVVREELANYTVSPTDEQTTDDPS